MALGCFSPRPMGVGVGGEALLARRPDAMTSWLIPKLDMIINYPSPVQSAAPMTLTSSVSTANDFFFYNLSPQDTLGASSLRLITCLCLTDLELSKNKPLLSLLQRNISHWLRCTKTEGPLYSSDKTSYHLQVYSVRTRLNLWDMSLQNWANFWYVKKKYIRIGIWIVPNK